MVDKDGSMGLGSGKAEEMLKEKVFGGGGSNPRMRGMRFTPSEEQVPGLIPWSTQEFAFPRDKQDFLVNQTGLDGRCGRGQQQWSPPENLAAVPLAGQHHSLFHK
eukprot:g44223.t1